MAEQIPVPGAKELSWAYYALDGRAHPHYFWSDGYLASFPPGAQVADIGCGNGWALQVLRDRGCHVVGTEVADDCLRDAHAAGRLVAKAGAEAIPLASNSMDAVVFGGVLPFTEEDQAFAELARILRPAGRMEAYYLGIGFAVRDLLLGVSLRNRYFGLRALINTLSMETFGRKLPGKFGDTVYVSHRRLAQLYARHGFVLKRHTPSPTFLGMTVFIYHSVERVGALTSAATQERRPVAASAAEGAGR